MNGIKHKEVKRLLSSDDLDLYPAKSLKSRDVEMSGTQVYFLDVGINPHMTFKYLTPEDRDQDHELLELYLD